MPSMIAPANSINAGILLRVYRELVSREDADRWVDLMP